MDKITLKNYKNLLEDFNNPDRDEDNSDFIIIGYCDGGDLCEYPESRFELDPSKIVILIDHLLELQSRKYKKKIKLLENKIEKLEYEMTQAVHDI